LVLHGTALVPGHLPCHVPVSLFHRPAARFHAAAARVSGSAAAMAGRPEVANTGVGWLDSACAGQLRVLRTAQFSPAPDPPAVRAAQFVATRRELRVMSRWIPGHGPCCLGWDRSD